MLDSKSLDVMGVFWMRLYERMRMILCISSKSMVLDNQYLVTNALSLQLSDEINPRTQ